jgi:hypothetical protein
MSTVGALVGYQSGVARDRSDGDNVLHLGPAFRAPDDIVTVTTPIGSKSSQVVRGSKPGSLAYIMLGQLFYDVSSEPSDAPERSQ